MADVVLTQSNHLFHDRKQVEKMQPYPPLQTLLAASVLREASISIALCDVTFDPPVQALEQVLDACLPRLLVICEDDFNFLSKMCLSRSRMLSFEMAKAAKERGILVAAHGCDSSDHPARDLLNMNPYHDAWRSAHGCFSLNLVSSRCCPYHCNWCSKPIWGDSYHVRSARLVAEEMRLVKQQYRPDQVWFADDIFVLSSQWALEFAQSHGSAGRQHPIQDALASNLVMRDTVRALKQAGFAEVWMGAESGSKKVLDAVDKGLHVEAIYRAREDLRRHGSSDPHLAWLPRPIKWRIDNSELVINSRWPTMQDIHLPAWGRAIFQVLSSWRYALGFHDWPVELAWAQRIVALRRPRLESL